MIIKTYARLDEFFQAFARERLNLLWVVGPPGVQKSRGLRSALKGKGHWIAGSLTAFGLYRELWDHRDQLLIIDDVDDIYRKKDAVNLLKGLCQTEARKIVGWHTDNHTLRKENIPRTFPTRSRVCLISNVVESSDENVAALLDRGHVVRFEPSALEVHRRVSTWFDDDEVFRFIGSRLPWISSPSMRDYVLAAELHDSRLDWQSWLLTRWGLQGTRLLVARLQAAENLDMATRLRIFQERTSEDEETYLAEALALGYRRKA